MEVANEIAGLSPAEEAFFESGGNAEIPAGEQAAAPIEDSTPKQEAETKPAEKAGESEDAASKTVSLAALHEERNRRREIQRQYQEAQQRIAEFQGKFSVLDRLYGKDPQADKPAAPPKPEEDIFGAVSHTTETVAQLKQRLDAQEAAAREAQEYNSAIESYRLEAARFEQQTPDFREAYNFLLNSRAEELKALGYDDPAEISKALVSDELAIAQLAKSKGKSAPELLYNLARQRGFAKKADPAPDPAKGAAKLETIRQGQEANRSLASAGGSATEGEMTAEMLLKMPTDEFEAWCEKNPAKARRLYGG